LRTDKSDHKSGGSPAAKTRQWPKRTAAIISAGNEMLNQISSTLALHAFPVLRAITWKDSCVIEVATPGGWYLHPSTQPKHHDTHE
jgi:hypothetical protein